MELKIRLRIQKLGEKNYDGIIGLRVVNELPETIISFTSTIASVFQFGLYMTLWKNGRFFLETTDNKLKVHDAREKALLQLLSEFIQENINALELEEEPYESSENSCEGSKTIEIQDKGFEQYLRQIIKGGAIR